MSENPLTHCKSGFSTSYFYYQLFGVLIILVSLFLFVLYWHAIGILVIFLFIGFMLVGLGSIVKRLNYLCDNAPETREREERELKALKERY